MRDGRYLYMSPLIVHRSSRNAEQLPEFTPEGTLRVEAVSEESVAGGVMSARRLS